MCNTCIKKKKKKRCSFKLIISRHLFLPTFRQFEPFKIGVGFKEQPLGKIVKNNRDTICICSIDVKDTKT